MNYLLLYNKNLTKNTEFFQYLSWFKLNNFVLGQVIIMKTTYHKYLKQVKIKSQENIQSNCKENYYTKRGG